MREEVVRLDMLPWCAGGAPQRLTPEEWIRDGLGVAVVGTGEGEERLMDVCGPEGAREVLKVVVSILGSLRVWGLGGEFKAVLEELMTRKVVGP